MILQLLFLQVRFARNRLYDINSGLIDKRGKHNNRPNKTSQERIDTVEEHFRFISNIKNVPNIYLSSKIKCKNNSYTEKLPLYSNNDNNPKFNSNLCCSSNEQILPLQIVNNNISNESCQSNSNIFIRSQSNSPQQDSNSDNQKMVNKNKQLIKTISSSINSMSNTSSFSAFNKYNSSSDIKSSLNNFDQPEELKEKSNLYNNIEEAKIINKTIFNTTRSEMYKQYKRWMEVNKSNIKPVSFHFYCNAYNKFHAF